jgi:hypothetical protein
MLGEYNKMIIYNYKNITGLDKSTQPETDTHTVVTKGPGSNTGPV